MPRPQKDPLRPLPPDEHAGLERLSRSHTEPAPRVARAKALRAVAAGPGDTAAAPAAGRRSGDAVAQWVARFHREGLAALQPGQGGGPPKRDTQTEPERIVREVRRAPDRAPDRTGTWSLATRRRALQQAPDGLPTVSPSTIWGVRHDAGFRWQQDRSWCETGTALRQRQSGTVTAPDPDAVAKRP